MAKITRFEDATQGLETSLQIINPKCRCFHPNFLIDVAKHEVTCKKCGATIDPFDALLEYANNQRRFIWEIEKYKTAKREFEKIQSEWSLTIREKRRIEKAMRETRYPANGFMPQEAEQDDK